MVKNIFYVVAVMWASLLSAQPVNFDNLTAHLNLPFEKYQLENGMSVILSEDRSTPFIAVNTWYNVGSVNEEQKKTGYAHFFEHEMFEGSRQVGPSQHFEILQNAGAHDINASTNFFITNYYQTVPSNQLDLTLKLESSRMFFLDLTQEKLDEQRAVVRREREQRFETAPYGYAKLALWQSVFPAPHPFYGKVIGSHEDLQRATLSDMQGFYDEYYGPSNACLTLVGNFDKDAIKPLIEKNYGSLPKSKVVEAIQVPKVKIEKAEIIRVEEKFGKLTLISMMYLTPALYQPGDADLDIISHILAGGEFGRLTKALTRDKMLASGVSVYQQSMAQTSFFTIDILLNPESLEKDVMDEVDRVMAELITKPATDTEIDRARNAIIKNQLFALQSLGGSGGRAELLQTYNRYAHNPGFLQDDIKRYLVANTTSIEHAAKTYLGPDSRKIMIAKPITSTVAIKGK